MTPLSAHECQYRVCYADSDQMGRVYYANYFVFAERARTEFLRDAGCSYKAMEEKGVRLVVRRCAARFLAPAVYDDLLVLRTRVEKAGHATLALATEVWREGGEGPLALVTVELACVDAAAGRPRPLPEALREAMRL